MTSFYLTLLSNSSLGLYPDNTTAQFTVELSRSVELQQDYECALVEISYPQTLFNVLDGQNLVNYHSQGIVYQHGLRPGYYGTGQDLLRAINYGLEAYELPLLDRDPTTGYVRGHKTPNKPEAEHLSCSETLMLQLGFQPGQNIMGDPHPHDTRQKSETGDAHTGLMAQREMDVTLGVPAMMFVYIDVVEPQVVSDVTTPLLRTVNIARHQYVHGSVATRTYENPLYVPVSKRHFSTVEVNLRGCTGKLLPFLFGTSTVVLHFRPASR